MGGFGWDKRLILPTLVLAARPLAQITRISFHALREVLDQDYVRTAHSKGLSRGRVLFGHVLRNAAIPILTTVAVSLRFSLSSLPLVELYFGWPGAGFSLLKGIAQRDDNLTVALLLCLGLLFIGVNLLLELCLPLDRSPAVGAGRPTSTSRPGQSLLEALHAAGDLLAGVGGRQSAGRLDQARRSKPPPSIRPAYSSRAARKSTSMSHRAKRRQGGERRAGDRCCGPCRATCRCSSARPWCSAWSWSCSLGPTWAPNNPAQTQGLMQVDGEFLSPPFAPGGDYPWGTDALGRGMLSLILAGARQTLTLALLAVAARTIVGVLLGAIAGWTQGSAARPGDPRRGRGHLRLSHAAVGDDPDPGAGHPARDAALYPGLLLLSAGARSCSTCAAR